MFLRTLFTALIALLLQATGLATGVPGVLFGAALATTHPTLVDLAKAMDPNGGIARIIELLSQTNELLDDMGWMEGNLITGHRTTVRTGLPTPTWRLLNQGVLPTKATTAQIDEQCGQLEAWSEVDVALAELGGNPGAFRATQARAHLEGMSQEMASTIFYGSSLAPEEFIGLAARYNALTGAGNSDNVINGGGTGSTDNTSIWLVAHDPNTFTGIYPKGWSAGLKHNDFGEETKEATGGVAGANMRVFREQFIWKAGIALVDWRYVVRIANIDISALAVESTAANLLRLMADAEERLPTSLGRRAFYMNRTVARYLRHQATSAVSGGGGLTFENYAGKRTRMFGITPVRITDAIVNTEDVVA